MKSMEASVLKEFRTPTSVTPEEALTSVDFAVTAGEGNAHYAACAQLVFHHNFQSIPNPEVVKATQSV